jgi:hypothetical protein
MPKNIKITRQATTYIPDIKSYKMIIEAIDPEEMSAKIFIQQRIVNFARGTTDDIFAAVCTPVQLEDFGEDSPLAGTSYFRTDKIELVGGTPELMLELFNSLVYEVKKLVADLNAMDTLDATEVFYTDGDVVTTVPAP